MSPSLRPLVEPAAGLTGPERRRYARHLTLPGIGEEGQRRLKAARVLVVGAGGLGSPALQYLAASGVGTIGIVDDDVVDETNLQRQVVHGSADVGRPKVESAADAVARLAPFVTVRTHPVRLDATTAPAILADYDLVLDGADNFATRYVVSDACALAGLPCVWGSILRFEGRVSVFWAGHGPTYRDLHPDPPAPGEVPSCADGGVLGMLPATIGAVMVTEAVKLITGTGDPLLGRVLLHDALAMTWREIGLAVDPDAPPVTAIETPETACAIEPEAHEVVTAAELADRLTRGEGSTPHLIDVREAWEREEVAIPGSVHVPLAELLDRGADALPREVRGAEVVLYCRSGGRSAQALAALRSHYAGREEALRHLDGGIEGWLATVDGVPGGVGRAT